MSVVVAVLSFIVALGLLVAVHEFGHFWVARRCGVKVLRFSIGFGKPLWSRRGTDGTEYVVAAIPLGGYVRMLDERDPDNVPGTDMARSFNRAPPLRKMAISAAGPAANFLFAALAYWAIAIIGVQGLKPIVGDVAPGTPAAVAGIHPGDELLAVRGQPTPTWEPALLALLDGVITGEPFDITVMDADGVQRELVVDAGPPRALTEPGALLPGLGLQPWQPVLPPRLAEIEPGGPADAAGLRPGDLVLAVDGDDINVWSELVTRVQAAAGSNLVFTVARDGGRIDLSVEIEEVDGSGRIGAAVDVPEDLYAGRVAVEDYNPLSAVPRAVRRTAEMSWLTVKMLARMLTGDVSIRNISGPINIAQYAGWSAANGLISFLGFLAIVSISLGIINLMPVPILDGGHLLYHLAELVRGRPVPEWTEAVGQRIGLGMLAMLMGLAFYNDLARLFG